MVYNGYNKILCTYVGWWNIVDIRAYSKGVIMGTFLSILLDILAILVIIVVGSIVVVVLAELILFLLDGGRKKKGEDGQASGVVKDDDVVVYSNSINPNEKDITTKPATLDGDKIEEIDYDKAAEEQRMLQSKNGNKTVVAPAPVQKPQKPVEVSPANNDLFVDDDEDDDFNKLLDEVIAEAKKKGESKEVKPVEPKVEEVKEETKKGVSEETQKELDELKELKAQQQKEIEEFKQLKEDFAREKEEQLAMLKDNLAKTQEDEIEKIREEALKEQEKIEQMKAELEAEKKQLEEEKVRLKEEEKLRKEEEKAALEEENAGLENKNAKLEEENSKLREDIRRKDEEAQEPQEPIIKETIIKDEEELNKLKYKNLIRMNNRLTRIIRDTERLQNQKQKEQERAVIERQRMLARQEQERQREQERQVELEIIEQEKIRREQEALEKKREIERKLGEASKRAGKYKLDSKVVKVSKEVVVEEIPEVIVEEVVTTKTSSSAKPLFEQEYYEARLQELDEELRITEKELRINKSEYIPLTRIHKAYARDGEKLRKKEMQVAKQKVALYGVNSKNVDPAKKAKLDENLQSLAELKDSVQHCEEVIKKNKDRYPILAKNNELITRQITRINDDIRVCEKALEYYKKNK